jgi:hypothetical protein
LRYRDQSFEGNIIRTAFVGGSVFIICSAMDDNIVSSITIEGCTFVVDAKHMIDEVDIEDSDGNQEHLLCFSNFFLKVDDSVTAVALKYVKKRCSGINKKKQPCGNYVRDPLLRCRWHM